MSEEAKHRSIFVHVPDYHRLIVWATDKSLSVFWNGYPSYPVFMASKGPFAVSRADLPLFDDFVSWAGKKHVPCWVEEDIWDVVIVSYKGFAAQIVVIEIPEFDGEVRWARGQISALLVESDVVDGVWIGC